MTSRWEVSMLLAASRHGLFGIAAFILPLAGCTVTSAQTGVAIAYLAIVDRPALDPAVGISMSVGTESQEGLFDWFLFIGRARVSGEQMDADYCRVQVRHLFAEPEGGRTALWRIWYGVGLDVVDFPEIVVEEFTGNTSLAIGVRYESSTSPRWALFAEGDLAALVPLGGDTVGSLGVVGSFGGGLRLQW